MTDPRLGSIERAGVVPGQWLEAEPIVWRRNQRTPLYQVRTTAGHFVIKLAPTGGALTSRVVRRLMGHLSLRNQAVVLKAIDRAGAGGSLRTPRLIATDRRSYLVMDRIPGERRAWGEWSPAELADALVRLQLSVRAAGLAGPVTRTVLRYQRSPERRFSLLLSRVGAAVGASKALHWRAVFSDCRRAQARLSRPLLIHGDFHYNNLLWDAEGRVSMVDFEGAVLDDRWAMMDAVGMAMATKAAEIDVGWLEAYLARLRKEAIFHELNLSAQIRAGFLLKAVRLMASRVPPREVKQEVLGFVEGTVADEAAWSRWLEDSVEIGR